MRIYKPIMSAFLFILFTSVFVPPVNASDASWSSATGSISVVENTTSVAYTQTANDGAAALTYSLGGGADDGLFTLNTGTGALSFTAAPDYETPGSAATSNTYTVEIDVTDGLQATPSTLTLTITVTDATASAWSSATGSLDVAENTTSVAYTQTASTGSGTKVYALGGGADDGLFTLNTGTGALSFTAAPDYETPGSAATSNTYTVEIDVTDDEATPSTLTLTITVTDATASAWSSATGSLDVAENTTSVAYTQTASTGSGTKVYALGGGADDGLFTLNTGTGALSFTAAPDYETPGSAATSNTYTVEIDVTDDEATPSTLTLTITVTDATASAWSSATGSLDVAENTTSVAYTQTASTGSGTKVYALGGGADDGLFTLNTGTGALSFTAAPDYETPGSAATSNTYTVEIDVTDDEATPSTLTLTITVTDATASAWSSATGSLDVAENTTSVAYTQTASTGSGTKVYALGGGADDGLFTLNTGTGALSFTAAPDYETPGSAATSNTYTVEIDVTDDEATPSTLTLTITVTDGSSWSALTGTVSVAENTTSVAYTQTASTGSGTKVYALGGGADDGLFTLNTGTGALSFTAAPDYETPGSAATSNTYTVEIDVTDNDASISTLTLTVTVTDVNENSSPTQTYVYIPTTPQAALTITSSATTVEWGSQAKLTLAGGSGTGKVTYSSTGTTFCAVDRDGILTPVSVGTCTVIATKDGDGTYGSAQSNSITITAVDKAPASTTGGSSTASGLSMVVGKPVGGVATVKFTVADTYAGERVSVILATKNSAGRTIYKTLGSAKVGSTGAVTFKTKVKLPVGAVLQLKSAGSVIFSKSIK